MKAGIQTWEAQDRSLSPVRGMALNHPHRIQGVAEEKIEVPRLVCEV